MTVDLKSSLSFLRHRKRRRTDSDTSFQLSDTDPGQESESPLSSSSVASSVSSGGSRKKLRSKRKLSSSSDGSTKRYRSSSLLMF